MIVLLCDELESLGNGLDLRAVEEGLAGHPAGVEVRRAPGPCERAWRWLDSSLGGADQLVLGLCTLNGGRHELQARARKLGLDPFAIQVLNLGASCALVHPKPQATEKAKLLLAGALARAQAYPGSQPENAKPLFDWDQQVSRRSLFTLPPVRYEVVPSIRQELCRADEGCRVCAKVCPRQALTPSDEGQMILNKASCTGCGACVSLCPRIAIEFPGASLPQIEAQLAVLLDSGPLFPHPRGILFLCQKSASVLERLARRGLPYPAGWLPVEVPCLGMVTPAWILRCLNHGASAVGLLPCPREECRFGQREVMDGRVDYCRKLVRLMDGLPDAVKSLDPTDATALARALDFLPVAEATGQALDFRAELRLDPRESAQAILGLTERYGASPDRALAHPHSPFGAVEVGAGCTGCGACASACPAGALTLERDGDGLSLSFDARLCIGCKECAPVCPERVVRVEPVTDLRRLSQGKRPLYHDSEARCEKCGAPVAPRAMLERIGAVLGKDPALSTIARYCLACRGMPL